MPPSKKSSNPIDFSRIQARKDTQLFSLLHDFDLLDSETDGDEAFAGERMALD